MTAFAVGQDGRLSDRRVWATSPWPPDGICFDADGAIWYADVPTRAAAGREGGEQEIKLDRCGFACMLGGANHRTLFITAARWFGMDRTSDVARTGQILAIDVAVSGAGRPYG